MNTLSKLPCHIMTVLIKYHSIKQVTATSAEGCYEGILCVQHSQAAAMHAEEILHKAVNGRENVLVAC